MHVCACKVGQNSSNNLDLEDKKRNIGTNLHFTSIAKEFITKMKKDVCLSRAYKRTETGEIFSSNARLLYYRKKTRCSVEHWTRALMALH